jgi:hypothetical protein
MEITENNACAVMVFNRKFNQQENRFEIAADFFEEFENCDVLGEFYLFFNEIGKDSEEDVFLVDMKFENIEATQLYYHFAGRAANASYYTKRVVELHVFSVQEVAELVNSKALNEFIAIKEKVVAPQHHVVFNNGEVEFLGEMYDVMS